MRGERKVRTLSITVPSLVGLGHRNRKKNDVFCLSRFLNDKVCERHFAINELEYGNDIGIFGKKNVCRYAPTFNFITLCGATAA